MGVVEAAIASRHISRVFPRNNFSGLNGGKGYRLLDLSQTVKPSQCGGDGTDLTDHTDFVHYNLPLPPSPHHSNNPTYTPLQPTLLPLPSPLPSSLSFMSSSSPPSSTPSNPSSSPPRPSCVVQETSLPWQTLADRKESFFNPTEPMRDIDSVAHVYRYKRRMLGEMTGGKQLGCSLMEVEPGGCTAFPYHAHAMYEEAVYILGGEGVMRMPKGDFKVGVGDYIALLPGEDGAHQLWNFHPQQTLRYLCMASQGKNDAVVRNNTSLLHTHSSPGPSHVPPLSALIRSLLCPLCCVVLCWCVRCIPTVARC